MKKLDKKTEALLRDPDTGVVLYELTAERKQKLTKLSEEIIYILRKRTEGPGEAMVLLHFLQETLEESLGTNVAGIEYREGPEN